MFQHADIFAEPLNPNTAPARPTKVGKNQLFASWYGSNFSSLFILIWAMYHTAVGGVPKCKGRTELNPNSEVTSSPSSLPMHYISSALSSLISCLAHMWWLFITHKIMPLALTDAQKFYFIGNFIVIILLILFFLFGIGFFITLQAWVTHFFTWS